MIKPDGTRFKFDLYDYLIYGDREKDLVVGSGDTVIIPGTNQFVELSGEILRPFIYEYKDDDTFADLLKFSLGVTNEANEKDIYFEEKIDSRIVTSKLIFDEKIDNKKLLSVYVPRDIVSNDFEIKIFGNSVQEKLLNRSSFKFLDEIVSTLSYADDVYPFYAVLEQTDESGLLKEVHSFSILDPQTYIDFKLKSNVSIKFFSRADIDSFQDSFQSVSDQLFEEGTQLAEERTLSLQGRNNDNINPSDLKFIGYGNEIYFAPLIGRVAPSYIYSFFGFSGEIDEFVLTGNFDNRPTNPNEPVLSDSVRQFIFPAPVNNSFDVLIEGNVNNPGTYVVDSQTSLEDLYNIAGGPLPNSDLSSIVLSRLEIREKEFESVQVAKDTIIDSLIANNANPINNQVNSDLSGVLSILEDRTINEFPGRLSGNLAPGTDVSISLLLKPGDRVYIPTVSDSVTVIGEILQPTTVIFSEKNSVLDYIKIAGNFTDYADKNKIYVIRSNGTSFPVSSNLFAEQYYPEAGDTIVVPRDMERVSTLPLVSVATKIISDIAFAAASLNSIRN